MRYCASCGTEVDESALFCPTCGQPLDDSAEAEIPPAPVWPDEPRERPEEGWEAEQLDEAPAPYVEPEEAARFERDEPTRPEARSDPGAPATWAPDLAPPPRRAEEPRGPQVSVPFNAPVTLSGWLIGIGAAVAALGILLVLFTRIINPLDLLVLLLLIGIVATIFFSASLPAIAHLRLAILVISAIALGMALYRVGFGATGPGAILFFVGTAAIVLGAVLVEIGRDRPLGGPQA